MKVRIKKVPQARTGYQVQGSLANDVPAMGGADYNAYIGKPSLKASKYMTAVPREEANLEAEGGETVYGDINGDGMPEHKTIKGPRHSGGGVPLNLPDDTFIYSDFRGMNIKEPEFLQMFGKGSKGKKSYTPAELAKQYDIEKYRKILQDPDSDKIDRKTAELMIKNYQNKLAALALVQEGKKGFPQGMPAVAKPMTAENQYTEDTFVDPSIKQFASQIDGKLQEVEQQQNTAEQDPDYAQQAQQAEEMNEGQPVAQPGEMEQPMAQYGMAMGGYDLPYGDDMPEAEYGMAMGINSRNYMGRPKSAMYARGGALRTYQGAEGASSTGAAGGAPADDGTLDVTGLDSEAANKKYYMWKDKHPGKEPNILLNGKPARYVPPTKKDNVTLDDLKALHISQNNYLEKELKDPKSKVREEYLKEYRAALKNRAAYGKTKNADKRFEMYSKMDISDDDAVKYLLSQKQRNDKIKEAGVDMQLFTNYKGKLMTPEQMVAAGIKKGDGSTMTLDDAKKINKQYTDNDWTSKEKVASAVGITLPDVKTTILEQASTHAIAGVQRNKKSGAYDKFDDDQKYSMYQFLGKDKSRETNTGGADETEMGTLYGSEYATMSPIDGDAENSTLAHGVDPAIDRGNFEAVPEEKKDQVAGPCPECTRADGSAYVPERNADNSCPPCVESGTPVQETEPKMWLQDKMKIAGAFGDLMGAKKYMPWAAKYDLRTPKPTFMDPTRELAANAEQANIQTQALGQFAGPQALSARSSGVMGAASKNAADVMAKYNNANVNIANQFESNISNIENQEQQLNTASQQKLYDQNTISNQQYDNTKRALRNNLLNQTTSGITNMMKTDAMNQIYPQFDVDASSGGKVTYDETKSRKVKPEMSGSDDKAYHDECSKYYKDEAQIENCVKRKMNAASSGGGDNGDAQKVMSIYKQKGGFIYSDITYPFIL
jgi:hypothetical protein